MFFLQSNKTILQLQNRVEAIKKEIQMAIPLPSSSSICSLLLMILFISTPSSANLVLKVSESTINAICTKTLNPSFCLGILKSYADHPHKRDITGLARITIYLAKSNATTTSDQIHSLIQHTDNPQLKERYTSCSKNYDNAIDDFKQAKKRLIEGNKNGLEDAAATAMGEFNACGENFRQPPADPSTLQKSNKNLLDFCSIVLVMTKFLP